MAKKPKKPPPDLFDLAAAKAARDEGMAVVGGKNGAWITNVLLFIAKLPRSWIGMGEDIRRAWNGPPPTSPNAWGTVTKIAVSRGLIVETGVWKQPKDKKSHACRKPEYRRA